MIKRILLWVLILAVLCGAAWWVYEKYGVTDEARVRRVIARMAAGLEDDNTALSVLRVTGYLSSKYQHHGEHRGASGGTIGKQTVKAFIVRLKQEGGYRDFEVDLRKVDVTVTDDTAQAVVTGRITAAPKGESEKRVELMTAPGQNRALLDLVKEDGDWKVVGSRRVPHDLDDAEER